jgi:hypothetical protein
MERPTIRLALLECTYQACFESVLTVPPTRPMPQPSRVYQAPSACARCPAGTVVLEAGGADTDTQQAIPGSKPLKDFRSYPNTMRVLGSQTVIHPKLAALALVASLAVGCGSAQVSTPAPTPSSTTSTSAPPSTTSAPPSTTSAPPSTTSTSLAPQSSTAVPTPSTAASCHPLTNSQKCYQPGQFCRNSDHGMSGVAGNGEKIVCKNQNGWRWELA